MSPIYTFLYINFGFGMNNRNEDFNRELERNLRSIRDVKGLSQHNLASLSGINKSQIGKIEGGIGNPTMSTVLDLAIALDVELNDLIPPKVYLPSRRNI